MISGHAVPRHPAPGARAGLINSVRPLTDGGTVGSTVHPEANPFGSELEVRWVRFDAISPDRWYVVAVALGEREPDWPVAAAGSDGSVLITWPDGTVDRLG